MVLNPLAQVARVREITRIFVRFGFGEVFQKMGLTGKRTEHEESLTSSQITAKRFVQALEALGPTFIKLGQVLSTRPDIFPEEWIIALEQLQEDVAPLEFAVIEAQLIEGLSGQIDDIFTEIDPIPIAAASIGQVHAAKLGDGTEVVLKVLRPGIAENIRSDVALLKALASLAEASIPELRAFRPTGIIREFERAITKEIDFTLEARNARRFADNFSDRDDIVVPKIYTEFSSRTILVMERIYGVKITDFAKVGADPKALASLGVDLVFSMAFVHGFFHADPHPGNIWALEGNRIAILDMGMADSVMPHTRDVLVDLLFGVISDDADTIGEVLLRLSDKPEDLDLAAYKRDVFQLYEDYVRGLPLAEISMADVVSSAIDAARKHKLVVPTDITMLLKSLATIEGVGKQLHPELDIVTEARPYVLKIVNMRWGLDRIKKDGLSAVMAIYELVLKLPHRTDQILQRIENGKLVDRLNIPQMNYATSEMTRSIDRLSFAIIIVALVTASGYLLDHEILQYKGIPILSYLGFSLAAALGSIVVIAPVLRRFWKR